MKLLRQSISTLALLVAFAVFGPLGSSPAAAQALIRCDTSIDCINGTGPYNTGRGDVAGDAFGIVNADFLALPSEFFTTKITTVPHGGTGVGTITGPIKGNGTSAFTAAAAADIVGLFSTCSGSQYLGADGSCHNASGAGTVASVAATVPSFLSISGSPITTSGTLAISLSGTALPVANGGTGAVTLTGPLKGNGTSAISPALAADIYGLWSGTCSSTTFLRGDGSCQTPSGGGNVSNTGTPTAGQFAEWTSATVIGGQTLIGDCSLSTATITCLKTNGTSFGALATTVPGTGVATALAVNIGTAGSPVVNGGALGTPASGVGTNLTGTAAALSIGGNAATATSATTAGNLSGTPALPNGTTATTQTTGDNTTKLATDAFVLANAASAGVSSVAAGGGIAVTGTGAGPFTGAVTVSANAPNRTVTSSPTVASTDMGGQINSNVTGGGTLTIPAVSSTVFPANSTLTVVNYSASTEAVSTTPTVNAGGGCVSGTGIPAGATWNITSNGTSLDCNQTVSAGGGSGTVASSTTGQIPVYTGSTTVTGSANATLTAGALTLGVSGTAGSVKMGNATSGTVTLQPVTGALGAVTASLPAATDTIVELTQTQTLTNKTISGSSNTLSNVALSSLATQAADTITANATGSSASPTAVAIASTMMAYLQANTLFTLAATGCTPSAHAGGAFSGTITLASGPCTSIIVTMNGATGYTAAHGYDCSVGDQTTQAAGTWIPKWGQTASSTTTATLPIPTAAGATDVISFACAPN